MHRTTTALITLPVAAAVVVVAVTAAATATGAPDVHATSPGAARPEPSGPEPGSFRHPRANPWFPLAPGTVWVLRGSDEDHRFTERVSVTRRHRTIDGVRARVVRDILRRADGSVAERTHDWYAADDRGTVWYLGERTAELDRRGHVVTREGSWEAGVAGAVAGRIMPAHPDVTDAYRQELRRGVAEDQAWVVQRGVRARTPAVVTAHGLRTLEWSRLEPRVVSEKVYVRGYGIVAERDLAGSSERFTLVRMHRPRR